MNEDIKLETKLGDVTVGQALIIAGVYIVARKYIPPVLTRQANAIDRWAAAQKQKRSDKEIKQD